MKKWIVVLLCILGLSAGCLAPINPEEEPETTRMMQDDSTEGMDCESTQSSETDDAEQEETLEEGKAYLIEASMKRYDVASFAEALLGEGYRKGERASKNGARYFNKNGRVELSSFQGLYLTLTNYSQQSRYSEWSVQLPNGFWYQDTALECFYMNKELPNGNREEIEAICDDIVRQVGFEYDEKEIYVIHPDQANAMEEWWRGSEWKIDDGAYYFMYRDTEFSGLNRVSSCMGDGYLSIVYSPKYGLVKMRGEPMLEETGRREVEIIDKETALGKVEALCQLPGYGVDYEMIEVTGAELVYVEDSKYDYINYGEGKATLRPCWKINFTWDKNKTAEFWANIRGEKFTWGNTEQDAYFLLDAITGDPGYCDRNIG